MRENILHFIWQFQYYSIASAKTTEGDRIQVLNQGVSNFDSGPDFSQSRVNIGDMEWNGDVEIHINSLDWTYHKHHTDEAYNKVILHVVWKDNGPVYRKDGTLLPTLELKELVDHGLLNRIQGLMESIDPIACSTQIGNVPEYTRLESIHRALIKRLERKALVVLHELETSKGNWSETAYRLLMKQMGMKINGETFYRLATCIPYNLVRKYKHHQKMLEALFFGTSGMLDVCKDDSYVEGLKEEYRFIIHKHRLTDKLNVEEWKFFRLRPSNFPTLRIAQLAALLKSSTDIFELLTEFGNSEILKNHLQVKPSQYWQKHYRFGKEAKRKVPVIGKTSIELILLNVVAPLLAAYSKHISDYSYMEKAVSLMETLPSERNRIIKRWEELGIKAENGAESQGLIELFNEHCQQKACLTCGIGYKILNFNS